MTTIYGPPARAIPPDTDCTGRHVRRFYPPIETTPCIDPALYGAWVKVLNRANRNDDYLGMDDRPIHLEPDGPFSMALALGWAERLAAG